MVRAQATVGGACAALDRNLWGMCSFAVAPVCGEFLVHVVRAKVELLGFAVFWTGFGHEDLIVTFENCARENHIAFWTDALCSAYELPDLGLSWLGEFRRQVHF